MAKIHPAAIVEEGAALGAGVEIGPFCVIGSRARLGEGVRILSHATSSKPRLSGVRAIAGRRLR